MNDINRAICIATNKEVKGGEKAMIDLLTPRKGDEGCASQRGGNLNDLSERTFRDVVALSKRIDETASASQSSNMNNMDIATSGR